MRPLVSYYGGKQRMASKIIPLFPPHTVYVETHCGGAAILFARPRPEPSNSDDYREVLNDHDERIMTMYRVCQDKNTYDLLLHRLMYTPYSRAEHAKALAIIRHAWFAVDEVTRAWAMVISLQQSFAHRLNKPWRTAVYSASEASSWASWRDALPAIMDRLRDVHLECDDALSVIRRWDSPQTLFYVDPPYIGTDQGHYKGFTAAHLQALITCLETCQGSVVLSGYASGLVPEAWEHFTFEAHSSASGQGKTNGHDRRQKAPQETLGDRRRVEHVWRVDRSAGMRQELKDVLLKGQQKPLPLFMED